MSIEAQLALPGRPGTVAYFIYYRIRSDDEGRVRQTLSAVHQRHQQDQPGLAVAVMRRPPAGDEHTTMMEIYTLDAPRAAALPVLDALAEASARAVQPLLASPRHLEVFEPCA